MPYPSWNTNFFKSEKKRHNESVGAATAANTTTNEIDTFQSPLDEMARIVSPFQIRVDECNRLWVMDTGLVDILGDSKQILPPALIIFDLNTDQLIRRYSFKPKDIKFGSFFANVVSYQT